MRHLPQLIKITPEGKIIAALITSPKSYSGLKSATKLSDRWLSKKLEELSSSGIVDRRGNNYQLKNPTEIINADPIFAKYLQGKISLKAKARLIAEEISHNKQVVAVILFGSVAKEQASKESDIDLLVVTETEMEDQLNNMIYN
jgi:DNA polymerase sigma